MTAQQFVESRPSRKRKVYERALEVYERRGLLVKDAGVATFVKAEKLDFSKKPDPAPRVIQPRTPVYNIAVGRFVTPLEPVLFNTIDKLFGRHKTVFKGMNSAEQAAELRAKWESVVDPVALIFDLRRMDQHVGEEALKFEHRVYDLFYRSKEFRRLLRMQLTNKGRGVTYNGIIKYIVYGRRMSGDMNTSLGNVVQACAIVFSAMEGWGHFELCNNGDDCVLIVTRKYVEVLTKLVIRAFQELGYPMVMEDPVEVFEHIEFCQTRPVFDGTRWTMQRDPRVCLDKDACTIKPVRTKADWDLLRNSIANSGMALAGNMPVFCEFYEALRRGAGSRVDRDTVKSGLERLAERMNAVGPVSDDARVSFFKAFNISPDEQIALEQHYRELKPVWDTPRCGLETRYEGGLGLVTGLVR
jgi:hypothetical protein